MRRVNCASSGTDHSIALAALARRVEDGAHAGVTALAGVAEFALDQAIFPNGCHTCEVEIDASTDQMAIANYVSVSDFGRILNPPTPQRVWQALQDTGFRG